MNKYYVYAHRKPNGEIFYIGKGSGKRAWLKNRDYNPIWLAKVNKYPDWTVDLLKDNLPEDEALEL